MPRISLNVIVFNEEARLEECLIDARDHVDEIVVVDQMSTDGTPEIAQRLADVYVRDVHHGHAEPSRALAADRSSGDWLLILDADERLSVDLKRELPDLVAQDLDGYWIQKVNLVDGSERDKIHHYRLARKSRVRFDPRPHGGAVALTENVERLQWTGIVHEKTLAEQIFDDARYERLALEEGAATSEKRNWLSHNRALRAERGRSRREDLELLIPRSAARVLIVGDVTVELPRCAVTRISRVGQVGISGAAPVGVAEGDAFDAAIVVADHDALPSARVIAGLVRPGGVVVGAAPAGRNQRRIEELIGSVLSDGTRSDTHLNGGVTRRGLVDELSAASLDVRWMRLRRDGWLDPLALSPDGSGTVVESEHFLLRSVSAEVAEELTADEIVFAAVRQSETQGPPCSVVVAALPGTDPRRFVDALRETVSLEHDYELVLVHSEPEAVTVAGTRSVQIAEGASLAARWNAGSREASGELLVFASADSTPLAGWLDALIQAFRSRTDTGAVGSRVVADDGTIEHAGLVIGPDGIPFRLYQGQVATAPEVNRHRIMPAVAGDGMVTSRGRFVEVGGFDETLGEDLTDADLCLRLRTRRLPVVYEPSAVLRSTPRSLPGAGDHFRRSAREFASRWAPTLARSDELVCQADGRDVHREVNRRWRLPRPSGGPGVHERPALVWTSHFLEHGGYTEEALAAAEALDGAGLHVIANPLRWDRRGAPMPAPKADRLAKLLAREIPAEFVHVLHVGAQHFKPHPGALRNIGRTMFETDGLPAEWRDQCNAMDEVWVPSEHNLRSFANAGVAPSKLHKIPQTFDPELFDPGVAPLPVKGLHGFVFLSMFSWIQRKAWDVLLRAWFMEFKAHDDVTLVLKTDDAMAPGTDCRREIEAFVRDRLKIDPARGPRMVVLDRPLDMADMPRLYRAADAFVLASRGEGWGRPYMEAMAMGLPTIATGWSGNLEFMNEDNAYLVDYKLVPAPSDSLSGQRWAQPSVSDLRRTMRSVYEDQTQASAIGQRGRADVLVSCRPELVAEAVRERLLAITRSKSRASPAKRAPLVEPAAPSVKRSSGQQRPSISACVFVQGDSPALARCLSSLQPLTDAVTIAEAGSGEDMASAHNEALSRASGDWVLMLDANQTLDPASIDVVRDLAKRDRFVGYAARELHQFGLDGAVSAIERRTVALFPRHPELRYLGRVEAQLLPQRSDLNFRLAPSRIVLHQHVSPDDRYDPIVRARRHLPLLERSAREEPHEPFHRYKLGIALQSLGLNDEAESSLRHAIAHAPPATIWTPAAYVSLSRAVANQGRVDEAVAVSKIATELAPTWPHAWCRLGATLVEAGALKSAVRAYTRALKCGDRTWLPTDAPDDTAWQIRAGLGKIHLLGEQYQEAARCLAGAVEINPTSAELRVLLARAYDGLRRPRDAERQLDRATMIARGSPAGFAALGDMFAKKAEDALLRGLVENAESSLLRERIERMRAARANA